MAPAGKGGMSWNDVESGEDKRYVFRCFFFKIILTIAQVITIEIHFI